MKKSELIKLIKRVRDDCDVESYTLIEAAMGEMEELNKLTMEQHNIMCHLRHTVSRFVESTITEIVVAVEKGVEIKTKRPQEYFDFDAPSVVLHPCQICGEDRAVQKCHVVPRELKGGIKGNIIYLCPTHHFLFDHRRLSKEEIEKMSLSDINDHSKEYFKKVILEDHCNKWKNRDLMKEESVAPCSICGGIPSYSIEEREIEDTSREVFSFHAKMHCEKCKTSLIGIKGNDKEEVGKQAIERWNTGERTMIMRRLLDIGPKSILYGNTLFVKGIQEFTGEEVCCVRINEWRHNGKYYSIVCEGDHLNVFINPGIITQEKEYLGKLRILEKEETNASHWRSVPHPEYKFNQDAELPDSVVQELIAMVVDADKKRENYPEGILVTFEMTELKTKEVACCTLDFTGISESLPRLKCFSADADWL